MNRCECCCRRFVGLVLFLIVTAVATADVTIAVDPPIVSSPDANLPIYLQEQLEQAYAAAAADLTELLGEETRIAARGRGVQADLSMSVILTDSPEYSALILSMTDLKNGATVQPFNYTAGWDDNLHRTISKAIVYLYLSVRGVPPSTAAEPVLLSQIATARISTKDLGVEIPVTPQGLATDSRGDLLIAGNGTIVRLDRFLRELGKLPPPPQANQYSWAGQIAVSASDMIYVQAITGGDLWEFSPDLPNARRIRTGGQSVGSVAVMEDGSIILHGQVDQNTIRIRNDQREELNLKRGRFSFVRSISGGPDNTIWTWDITTRLASISDPGGYEIDVVIPVIDATEAAYVSAIAPYPNGDLLIGSQNALHRVDRNGVPVWTFNLSDNPAIGTLLGMSSIAFDSAHGLIYVNDPLQGRIFQILDVEYADSIGGVDETTAELVSLSRRLGQSPDDVEAVVRRAEIYEQLEAWIPSYYNWDLAQYLSPNDANIAAGLVRVETAQQKQLARAIAAKAREVLRSIGRATAQTDYFNALAIYEQLLAMDPGNDETADEMYDLIEEFEQPVRPRERNPFPLTIASLEMDDVFPSLSLYYRSNPIGSVVIRNDLDIPVTAVRVKLEMNVMDFPTSSDEIAEILPGATATVQLFVRLGERILSQRGRLLVQPRVSVEYTADGENLSVSEVTEIFAHSNTAITWDDSRKLAAFIMPDEQIASDFGSRYAAIGDAAEEIDLSARLFRAIRLADVVGALGITYVEDPLLGISRIFGMATVVDSVRYPRDTLRVEAGDCDDTTALLATLYEATGIRTAIMTSPGHVFMAFNTGEPTQNAWLFESDTTVAIQHDGSVWLPLETTILERGFNAAWVEGSRLWNRYEPTGEIEFLPVEDAHALYEPIPTGNVGFDFSDLDDPIAAGADILYDESLLGVVALLYTDNVTELENALRSQSDRQKLRSLNKVGILHARFNKPRLAERAFDDAIDLNPDYTTSYINLANLRIISDEPGEAIALLREVTDRRPGSILANLLLAQANQMLGNRSEARQFMVIVEEHAPELASRYPHLTGGGVGRASEAQSIPVLPWPADEE